MKYVECEIPEKVGYLIPISDTHLGDKSFSKASEQKLFGYLKWIKKHPNSRILLLGDIFNCNTRESAGSPFEQTSNEFQRAVEIFEPYRDQIIGGIIGNHSYRLVNYADVNMMQMFCMALKIPYLGFSSVIRFKIGKRKDGNRFLQNYLVYAHHSCGGGDSIGSKLNRASKLQEVVEGVDAYLVAHNHALAAAPMDIFYPSLQGKKVEKKKRWYISCGGYIDYADSYAEMKMMAPTHLGSPRIRFDSNKHDIHVNL